MSESSYQEITDDQKAIIEMVHQFVDEQIILEAQQALTEVGEQRLEGSLFLPLVVD